VRVLCLAIATKNGKITSKKKPEYQFSAFKRTATTVAQSQGHAACGHISLVTGSWSTGTLNAFASNGIAAPTHRMSFKLHSTPKQQQQQH